MPSDEEPKLENWTEGHYLATEYCEYDEYGNRIVWRRTFRPKKQWLSCQERRPKDDVIADRRG
jgi:hypothetical protein